jgi:hypothetical protein
MRLVAFGILAAMLGAGCAFQAGDPGDPAGGTPTALTTSDTTPKVHPAVNPTGASSSAANPPNPEPSPWTPSGDVAMDEESNGANPEPSPWQPDTPSQSAVLNGGDPQRGAATGTTSGSTGGSTPNRQGHLGAL